MFSKVGSALKRAKEGLAAITHAASELMSSGQASSRRPGEELLNSFKDFCAEIDTLAEADDMESTDGGGVVIDTNVFEQLSVIIDLLRRESREWSLSGGDPSGPLVEYDAAKLQCLEVFVENHMMHEICMRAIRDIPRGCMPIVLNATALLLQSVRYPLLVHQTIHKPIANLVSIAARFDALKDAASYSGVRKRSSFGPYRKQDASTGNSSAYPTIRQEFSTNEDMYKREIGA